MSNNFKKIGFDFVPVSKSIAFDYELSYKAKGVYLQLASLPEDWHFTIEGLTKLGKDGKDGIRTSLIELEEHGYLKREQTRNPDGLMGESKYTLFNKPVDEKPTSVNPSTEKPIADKTTQYVRRNNKKLTNREEIVCSNEHTKEDTSDMENLFEIFWTKYPKKQSKKVARVSFMKYVSKSNIRQVLDGLDRWLRSKQWHKENGQYIPLPATWLNQEKWNDELKQEDLVDGGEEDFLNDDDEYDLCDPRRYREKESNDFIDADYTTKA